jgi:hypothetical protein
VSGIIPLTNIPLTAGGPAFAKAMAGRPLPGYELEMKSEGAFREVPPGGKEIFSATHPLFLFSARA